MSVCMFAKPIPTIMGELDSTRECECSDRSTCPKSVFANPVVFGECSVREAYLSEPIAEKSGTYSVKPILEKREWRPEPKFTRAECGGCQYKATSYCWGQCSFNIWKRKSDW